MAGFQALETQISADDTNGTSANFKATVALAVRYLANNPQNKYMIDDLVMYNELKRQVTNPLGTPLVPFEHLSNQNRKGG